MASPYTYWVYILASKPHGTLYIGVTNSLERRTWQHRSLTREGFTQKYAVTRLVYYESFRDISNAITREKQLKGWLRAKKVALIEKENPLWRDLAEVLFDMDTTVRSALHTQSVTGVQLDSSLRSE